MIGLRGRAVPDGELVARLPEIVGDGLADGAETEEADSHAHGPSPSADEVGVEASTRRAAALARRAVL